MLTGSLLWMNKGKLLQGMCTFVYYAITSVLCPSGGLVSLDLRRWRRLTCHRHLAQQCPFKDVHLQQARRCSASRLHSATLFDKRPRVNGGRTPQHQHHPNILCCLLTDSHSEQMSNHGFWHSHFIPCIIVQWEALCTGRPSPWKNHLHLSLSSNWWLYWLVCDTCRHCHHFSLSSTEREHNREQPW